MFSTCKTDQSDTDCYTKFFTMLNLSFDSSMLIEDVVPRGYQSDTCDSQLYGFTLATNSLNKTYAGSRAIKNGVVEGPTLRSGGVGRNSFFIAGGGVSLLTLAALALFGRKQKLLQHNSITRKEEVKSV